MGLSGTIIAVLLAGRLGQDRGRQEGFEEGRTFGFREGHGDGFASGYAEGHKSSLLEYLDLLEKDLKQANYFISEGHFDKAMQIAELIVTDSKRWSEILSALEKFQRPLIEALKHAIESEDQHGALNSVLSLQDNFPAQRAAIELLLKKKGY